MSNITLSAPVYYRAGISGVSAVVGVESTCNRVARYEFTAPSTGASSVTLSLSGLMFIEGTVPEHLGFYIGTDPTSHINAGAGSTYTGLVKDTATAELLLLPGKRYYLFLFPVTTDYGWYSMELATVTLDAAGGSYSVPSVTSPAALGTALTVRTNRHADFTHTLSYTFGNATGVIAQNVTDSCTWTPPLELARQIPNAASGVGAIHCATYRGSTQIGTTQTVPITLTVPDSVVPTVSAAWRDTSANPLGLLVKLVSALAVTVDAAGACGSTVTATTVTVNGKPYAGGALTEAGTLPLVVTVKDSRGRTGSASYSLAVSDYETPQLTLNASRCTEDGTADDTGEFCLVTITGSTTQVGGRNTAALSFTYGATTESIDVEVGAFEHTQIVPAPSTATLDLSATLSDQLLSVTRPMVLSVGYATMDFLKGGKGIAFGTTATKEGFQCAMDAYFSGQLYRLTEGEKEWLFPPMELGVEYRTAERFLGRPVYACLMDFGALTNGTEKICNHGLGLTYPISISGVAFSNSWCFALPIVQGGMSTSVVFNKNAVIITSPGDWSAYRAYVLLKYVK